MSRMAEGMVIVDFAKRESAESSEIRKSSCEIALIRGESYFMSWTCLNVLDPVLGMYWDSNGNPEYSEWAGACNCSCKMIRERIWDCCPFMISGRTSQSQG